MGVYLLPDTDDVAVVGDAVMSSRDVSVCCTQNCSLPMTRGRYVRCSTCRGRTTVSLTTVLTSCSLSMKCVSVGLESLSPPSYTAGLQSTLFIYFFYAICCIVSEYQVLMSITRCEKSKEGEFILRFVMPCLESLRYGPCVMRESHSYIPAFTPQLQGGTALSLAGTHCAYP